VLTSLWEGLPVSVLEAMSASLPVVATDTGGVREIIKDGETGFLVSVKDIRKLSKMVSSLLQDESQRKIIGQNAKSYLGFDFRIENMVNNTQELYENLIRAKTDNHDE
jgi:glycosyltransferase involved in cell wall biosynthesis